MTPSELLQAGDVRGAQQALSAWLRDHPSDAKQRTFLFELLCLCGDFERAKKQLAILADGSQKQELGAVLYFSALHAEEMRHRKFRQGLPPQGAEPILSGRLNGNEFHLLSDADPAIGGRLEVFAAGSYLWIPFAHLSSVHMDRPRRLRDTLWMPATLSASEGFENSQPREVLLPAIYPFSWEAEDENLWLGRTTDWVARNGGEGTPRGQKLLIADGEEIPFLEVRSLEFDQVKEPENGIA